jgi:hypothetical protein
MHCNVRKIWGTLSNPKALSGQKAAALLDFILGLLVLKIAPVSCVPTDQGGEIDDRVVTGVNLER